MNPDNILTHTPSVDEVSEALFLQLMNIMGLHEHGTFTRGLHLLFIHPVRMMSRLLVELDQNIAEIGWNAAMTQFTANFVNAAEVINLGEIPSQGPLMFVGNHPAAYDIGVLATSIPREDIKIMHSDIPIMLMLPNISAHGIPVPYNINARLKTVRTTIKHLQTGGSVFIFARGNVEPDPTVSPGAEESLNGWSPSLEMFLRKVPETKTVVAISSGMLSKKWFNNLLVRQWKTYEQRQKVAEIFQIISQLVTRRKPATKPKVSFSDALSVSDLGGENAADGELVKNIIAQARQLMADHHHA